MPRERSAVPIDADVEIVLIPDGDLRALEDAFGVPLRSTGNTSRNPLPADLSHTLSPERLLWIAPSRCRACYT